MDTSGAPVQNDPPRGMGMKEDQENTAEEAPAVPPPAELTGMDEVAPPQDAAVEPPADESPAPAARLYQLRPAGLRPHHRARPRPSKALRNDCPPEARRPKRPGPPPARLR